MLLGSPQFSLQPARGLCLCRIMEPEASSGSQTPLVLDWPLGDMPAGRSQPKVVPGMRDKAPHKA